MQVEIVGVVATIAFAVSGAIYRFVIVPIKETANDAMSKAKQAEETAQGAQDDIEDLTHLLVNGDSEAHDGVLIDLQNHVEDIKSNQDVERRLSTERAVLLDDIRRAINDSDLEVAIPDRDDDFFRGKKPNQ